MQNSGGGTTVLVVEDDEDVADVYTSYLRDTYDVRTAYSGTEGLEKFGPEVDVVLLDRRMPQTSGDEVLTRIRNFGYTCPVVFITAVEPDLDILALDFDEYLTKPVSSDDVVDVVEAMLERREHVEMVRESLALVSRMATLEAKMDVSELEASREYTEAQRRFDELRRALRSPPDEDLYSSLVDEKLEVLFEP